MNKKEEQQLEKYKIMLALKFKDEVAPDIIFKKETIKGYTYNKYTKEVVGVEVNGRVTRKIGKRQIHYSFPIDLYSTKLLAIKAMRFDIAMEYAMSLREFDELYK